MNELPMNIFKFILAVLLFPFVLATAITAFDHFYHYPALFQKNFQLGMWVYVLMMIFICRFSGIYDFGQRAINGMIKFLSPFDVIITDMLPFYTLCLFAAYIFLGKFLNLQNSNDIFIMLAGLSFSMHVSQTALELQGRETAFLKPSYYFTMCLVFVFNIILMVLLLDLIRGKFTVDSFVNSVIDLSRKYYFLLIKKIVFFK